MPNAPILSKIFNKPISKNNAMNPSKGQWLPKHFGVYRKRAMLITRKIIKMITLPFVGLKNLFIIFLFNYIFLYSLIDSSVYLFIFSGKLSILNHFISSCFPGSRFFNSPPVIFAR